LPALYILTINLDWKYLLIHCINLNQNGKILQVHPKIIKYYEFLSGGLFDKKLEGYIKQIANNTSVKD